MKTWRERIAEARERGHFTNQDKSDMYSFDRCMVGEVALALFGTQWRSLACAEEIKLLGYNRIHADKKYSNANPYKPIFSVGEDDMDMAEKALDYIEDQALELKREHLG